jgi:hypothetical protein
MIIANLCLRKLSFDSKKLSFDFRKLSFDLRKLSFDFILPNPYLKELKAFYPF